MAAGAAIGGVAGGMLRQGRRPPGQPDRGRRLLAHQLPDPAVLHAGLHLRRLRAGLRAGLQQRAAAIPNYDLAEAAPGRRVGSRARAIRACRGTQAKSASPRRLGPGRARRCRATWIATAVKPRHGAAWSARRPRSNEKAPRRHWPRGFFFVRGLRALSLLLDGFDLDRQLDFRLEAHLDAVVDAEVGCG